MAPRLGVNIDHVATLRQARGEFYPCVKRAAQLVLENGGDQITIHLREDRRHIQDQDVFDVRAITSDYGKPLNFEMGCNPEIIEIAKKVKPDWVCLVPEKREEKTTEGGLDLLTDENFSRVNKACVELKKDNPKLKISLFLESNPETLKQVPRFDVAIDAVEIHTGDYAKAFLLGQEVASYLKEFESAERFLAQNKINCHAGHGLTMDSMGPLLEMELFSEFNIGHWIISEAVFQGLGPVIRHLKKLIQIKETPRISDKSFI